MQELNNKTFEEILAEGKGLSLQRKEKEEVRASLLSYIKNGTVRTAEEKRQGYEGPIFLKRLLPILRIMPIILIIAILAGGSVSFAAEGALPGDVLYTVKMGVNEKVTGLLAFSEEAKADHEVTLTERRLEEAEELALRGELNSEIQANVSSNFSAHAERVQKRIAKFETAHDEKTAAEVSSRFETSLRAHEQILEKLTEKEERRKEVTPILEEIRKKIRPASEAREKAEVTISAKANGTFTKAAEGKKRAAENKLKNIQKFLARNETALDAHTTTETKATIKATEEVIVKGNAALNAGASGRAFTLFQNAIRIADEAKLLIEAEKKLGVNLETRVSASAASEARQEKEPREDENTPQKNTEQSSDRENGTDNEIQGSTKTNIKSDASTLDVEGNTELRLGK